MLLVNLTCAPRSTVSIVTSKSNGTTLPNWRKMALNSGRTAGAVAGGQPESVESLELKLRRLFSRCKTWQDALQVLEQVPEADPGINLLAEIWLGRPVQIHYAIKPDLRTYILRRGVYDACDDTQSLEALLKQQLGIEAGQKVRISFSDDGYADSEQVDLTNELVREYPLPFLVGRAEGWYVAESDT